MKTKLLLVLSIAATLQPLAVAARPLEISANRRYFATPGGRPFFWLADTAWLLLKKCTREETVRYLDTRKRQGFNVVQVMVVHDIKEPKNAYGALSVDNGDVSRLRTTPGARFGVGDEYDFWDHLDWTVGEAEKRGIFVALVPVWGSNVKSGAVAPDQAAVYAKFLAERYRGRPNVVWMNGGDLRGSDGKEVWQAIGRTLRANDPNHLITFHPRGRYDSSDWFHNETWLDFNMFQSGHRDYSQDVDQAEPHRFGEDNWRYAASDWARTPVKPTLDGEPSYENIPHGLHDPKLPRWNAADVRRYAWWSVLAGAAGFTYGENSVMQFYDGKSPNPAYGAELPWTTSIDAEGANQLAILKKTVLALPGYFERFPAPELVADQGDRYERVAAMRGRNWALFYVFSGRSFKADLKSIGNVKLKAEWLDPRTGKRQSAGPANGGGIAIFDPPGETKNGNDWVLVLSR